MYVTGVSYVPLISSSNFLISSCASENNCWPFNDTPPIIVTPLNFERFAPHCLLNNDVTYLFRKMSLYTSVIVDGSNFLKHSITRYSPTVISVFQSISTYNLLLY